jgi:hypothetical protein
MTGFCEGRGMTGPGVIVRRRADEAISAGASDRPRVWREGGVAMGCRIKRGEIGG